jgi:hypothetical protein
MTPKTEALWNTYTAAADAAREQFYKVREDRIAGRAIDLAPLEAANAARRAAFEAWKVAYDAEQADPEAVRKALWAEYEIARDASDAAARACFKPGMSKEEAEAALEASLAANAECRRAVDAWADFSNGLIADRTAALAAETERLAAEERAEPSPAPLTEAEARWKALCEQQDIADLRIEAYKQACVDGFGSDFEQVAPDKMVSAYRALLHNWGEICDARSRAFYEWLALLGADDEQPAVSMISDSMTTDTDRTVRVAFRVADIDSLRPRYGSDDAAAERAWDEDVGIVSDDDSEWAPGPDDPDACDGRADALYDDLHPYGHYD